jgi:ribosome modulation factor
MNIEPKTPKDFAYASGKSIGSTPMGYASDCEYDPGTQPDLRTAWMSGFRDGRIELMKTQEG